MTSRLDTGRREPGIRGYRPIADYGIIGNLHTAALVAIDGSIDWACLPHFDSPAVFLRLLDCAKGGYCAFRVSGLAATSRRYAPSTNVLETTFTSQTGVVVLTDFMPVCEGESQQSCRIIRLAQCTRGYVDYAFECRPTPGFASQTPRFSMLSPDNVKVETGSQTFLLQGPGLKLCDERGVAASSRVSAGETHTFAISCGTPGAALESLNPAEARAALDRTMRFWTQWSGRLRHEGDYRDEVLRSVLTLKLLTFAPTGAVVAAPTTSLPETIGGKNNWDYRLSWIRDSQFVLTALMRCGYFEEARRFFQFLRQAYDSPADQLRILYTIHGRPGSSEKTLDELDGYLHSRPVRAGNAASTQKQLDIYGELINCLFVYCRLAECESEEQKRMDEIWPMARSMADYVARHWREPDHGIWESREPPRHYVHSKGMCCAGLDRAMKLAAQRGSGHDVAEWARERDEIMCDIRAHGFDRALGAFVRFYGSKTLDAAILRLPLLGVIPADDAQMLSTIGRIESKLRENGLIFRYGDRPAQAEDGAFTSCTLWLINNYILLGRIEQAREAFDHLISFRNDLGLFSEEIDPRNGCQLGNFPQAITHVGIISAIHHLERGLHPADR